MIKIKASLITLLILLAVSIAFNIAQYNNGQEQIEVAPTESETPQDKFKFEPKSFKDLESIIQMGDLTWDGRVTESDTEEFPTYQLIKIDKQGNETIMHEAVLDSLFPSINLQTYQYENGNQLKLIESKGYPEGGTAHTIFFMDGEELTRSSIQSFWGFVQVLTFQIQDSPTYTVELVTTGGCQPTDEEAANKEYLRPGDETDLIGIKISAPDFEEIFDTPERVTVSCSEIDGGTVPPTLRTDHITTHQSGISIDLPVLRDAHISLDDKGNLEVNYY